MIIGFVGVFVVIVLGTVICVLFLRLRSAERGAQPKAAASEQSLSLPTASVPTATPGPPAPRKIVYTAEEPITGFSNCNAFGFHGMVVDGNGAGLQSVQIVIWEAQAGLLALTNTDADGHYSIEIQDPPAPRRLWVQVYEDDVPVSRPVFVETQIDCENGYQVYQIDWQRVSDE